MFSVNQESIFKSITLDTEPPTEDLQDGDEKGEFIPQKRRNRKYSQKSVSSGQGSPAPKLVPRRSSRSRKSGFNLFVDRLPVNVSKDELVEIFSKFGKILSISICRRNPDPGEDDETPSNFAFITFDSLSAVDAALQQDSESGIFLKDDHQTSVRVHRRKFFAGKHNRVCSSSENFQSLDLGHPTQSEWRSLLEKFDWSDVALKYVSRRVTMEDYFREYVKALASYRGVRQESVENLKKMLIFLSEHKPKDPNHIMPPSISGLVYNQKQEKCFNLKSLLSEDGHSFQIENQEIHYLSTMRPYLAEIRLKEILIEGLFIYFFAKFAHGPLFLIKNSYYERSEPVRSALLLVTGVTQVTRALKVFFHFFNKVFCFDEKKSELKLKVDHFSKEHRDKRKLLKTSFSVECSHNINDLGDYPELTSTEYDEPQPFVMDNEPDPYEQQDDKNVQGQISFASSYSPDPVDGFFRDLDAFLDPVELIARSNENAMTPDYLIEMPASVQSVVHYVLDEECARDYFLTDQEVIDSAFQRFHESRLSENQKLKIKKILETETRILFARLLAEAR